MKDRTHRALFTSARNGDVLSMSALADYLDEQGIIEESQQWRTLALWLPAVTAAIDFARLKWPKLGVVRSELRRIPSSVRRKGCWLDWPEDREPVYCFLSFQHRLIVLDVYVAGGRGHLGGASLTRSCLAERADYLTARLTGLLADVKRAL